MMFPLWKHSIINMLLVNIAKYSKYYWRSLWFSNNSHNGLSIRLSHAYRCWSVGGNHILHIKAIQDPFLSWKVDWVPAVNRRSLAVTNFFTRYLHEKDGQKRWSRRIQNTFSIPLRLPLPSCLSFWKLLSTFHHLGFPFWPHTMKTTSKMKKYNINATVIMNFHFVLNIDFSKTRTKS